MRKIHQKENGNLAMEMAFWHPGRVYRACAIYHEILSGYLCPSVCRAVYWNVEQAALNMNGCMCDKWYTLMID